MLGQEADKLGRWSVVGELGRVNITLSMQHLLKQGLAVATTLDRLVHIEVKDAKRGYLAYLSILLPYKQLT